MNIACSITFFLLTFASFAQIPLPEHPRPDFERKQWLNLNGYWDFEYDSLDTGVESGWARGDKAFSHKILVPFPWGSELSTVKNLSDIAWYKREIKVSPSWQGRRVFVVVGASDWQTDIWLDGQHLGTHRGGYVPFSFELTGHLKYGEEQQLVIRVDDKRRRFTLYGKQSYGDAKGIWQTVYLEARGQEYLDHVQFLPDIDSSKVRVRAFLPDYATRDVPVSVHIQGEGKPLTGDTIFLGGEEKVEFDIEIPDQRLWSLDDPFLYNAKVVVADDTVNTYFGMRKISIVDLPGTNIPYVGLNDQPVYLQMALDQAYHPEGFYTFPSDDFIKREVSRAKDIGLNGLRPHIKVPIPRKLYWADKLGMLIMADLPNNQDPPNARSQYESEYTLREMINRDYNHPSIFSWVVFNESWGLRDHINDQGKKKKVYLPREQQYAASMYYLTRSLDPTRLVDDNSHHSYWCVGHTITDLNSSHDYLMGFEWESRLKVRSELSYDGSTFQYAEGFKQRHTPSINAECGNVWGYKGTTGDVDWSYDYHRMVNTFRKYPKMAGWLYTEHHDVIKEWNGYWRYDRSLKYTGLGDLVEGMTINDFHAPVYLSTGNDICLTVQGGEKVEVPLYLSSMSGDNHGEQLEIAYELSLTNIAGTTSKITAGNIQVKYDPFIQKKLEPLSLYMPNTKGLAILKLFLKDKSGNIIHRNFMHFEIEGETKIPDVKILSKLPSEYSHQQWESKQWDVFDGKKVNGTGKGSITYTFELPDDLNTSKIKEVFFIAELSAKQLFIKDLTDEEKEARGLDLNYRKYPDSNPNAYPMSDETMFPSEISIFINDKKISAATLPDDPADHRGVLSWHHQVIGEPTKDQTDLSNWHYTLMGRLNEAGSYGYLTKVKISKAILKKAFQNDRRLAVKIATKGNGGLAIYGDSFGRYPINPSIQLIMDN